MSRVDTIASTLVMVNDSLAEGSPYFAEVAALAILGALGEYEKGDRADRGARAFEKLYRGKAPYTFDAEMTPETEALVDRVLADGATNPTGSDTSDGNEEDGTPSRSLSEPVGWVAAAVMPVHLNGEDSTSATAAAKGALAETISPAPATRPHRRKAAPASAAPLRPLGEPAPVEQLPPRLVLRCYEEGCRYESRNAEALNGHTTLVHGRPSTRDERTPVGVS